MSLWLEVFCQNHLGEIDLEAMRLGIGKRLTALTYLYCPDDEEEAAIVLNRLQIKVDAKRRDVFFLQARKEPEKFIRVERFRVNVDHEDIREKFERFEPLRDQESPDLKRVQDFLKAAKEAVAFQLMNSDLQTMGWPVAVAAAAWIAEIGNGIIWNDNGQWMIPNPHDVNYVFDENDHKK